MFLFCLDILEVLILLISVLFSVAYLTIAERKTMGYMQRRLGPNYVGWLGSLQAFADAIKLLIKEIIIPRESNAFILIISPLITLITALLGWLIIPFGPGISLGPLTNGVLFSLAISSIGVFGTLLSGWSSNSKYGFLGSIRGTAQLISYELVLTTITIICLMFIGSINFTDIIEIQRSIWLIIPLLPLSLLYFISTVAETSRPPFDLTEAESELVAGFMTEYSASPFVFFFLGEYSNLAIMSAFTTIFFLGGYLYLPLFNLNYLFNSQYSYIFFLFEGLFYGLSFGLKICSLMFTFIWIRASFPRFTYDNLIHLCWVIFLPLLFSILIIIPSLLYLFNALSLALNI